MFNTVVKVGAVALLGGAGIFAGYQYTQNRNAATEEALSATAAVTENADQADAPEVSPETSNVVTADLDGQEATEPPTDDHSSTTSEEDPSVMDADEVADATSEEGDATSWAEGIAEMVDEQIAESAAGEAEVAEAPEPAEDAAQDDMVAEAVAQEETTEAPMRDATDDETRVTQAPRAVTVAQDQRTPNQTAGAKVAQTGGFTAPTQTVRNAKLVDKKDDGGFTPNMTADASDPCLKADGTPYTGPGTALNPFADESPCLQPVTASSFAVAEVQPVTASDVAQPTTTYLPPIIDFFDPITAFNNNFGSDYPAI